MHDVPPLQEPEPDRAVTAIGDQPQDVSEEPLRNRNLGHLEGDVAAVTYRSCADLDRLLPPASQRTLLVGPLARHVSAKYP